jgi:hypothetical protein
MSTCAIHIIWTTYATWLPGDPRGHWSPLYDLYGQLQKSGHRLNIPDKTTHDFARSRLIDTPKSLEPHERFLVAATLAEHFNYAGTNSLTYTVPANVQPGQGRGYMKPQCLAAAIEETHIHLLLGPIQEDLDRYVGRLKGATSAALNKLPQNNNRTHNWTAKFWRVFLFDDRSLPQVRTYIRNHNLRRKISTDPFDWITPT